MHDTVHIGPYQITGELGRGAMAVAIALTVFSVGVYLLKTNSDQSVNVAPSPSEYQASIVSTPTPNPALPEAPCELAEEYREPLPDGFVYVTDLIPDAILDIRYYSTDNFIGARVDGYEAPTAILATPVAEALKVAADDLRGQGYTIKIFDAYRPQRASDHFMRWARDLEDIAMKEAYYPDIDKSQILHGYLAEHSGHNRGSTVDLTIVDTKTGEEIDMGTRFDFLGEASNHYSWLVTEQQNQNRLILKQAMEQAGFEAYLGEWWDYTFIDEPYPDTYFDFVVQ